MKLFNIQTRDHKDKARNDITVQEYKSGSGVSQKSMHQVPGVCEETSKRMHTQHKSKKGISLALVWWNQMQKQSSEAFSLVFYSPHPKIRQKPSNLTAKNRGIDSSLFIGSHSAKELHLRQVLSSLRSQRRISGEFFSASSSSQPLSNGCYGHKVQLFQNMSQTDSQKGFSVCR